jgi:hypothetical protein
MLSVTLADPGRVRLRVDETVPEATFAADVAAFWVPPGVAAGERSIEVGLPEFAAGAEWLRSVWVPSGRLVQVDEAAAAAVRAWRDTHASLDVPPVEQDVDVAGLVARPLTPEQDRNVRMILARPNAANFSVPGAGKTATALVEWSWLRTQGMVDRLCVVGPKSAFEAWQTEPAQVLSGPVNVAVYSGGYPSVSADILVVNYEQLESADRLAQVRAWIAARRAMVIFDEAHRVKRGPAGARWRACRELSLVAARREIVTGTPMPQDVTDVENLMELAWPGHGAALVRARGANHLAQQRLFVRTTKDELGLPPMTVHEPIRVPMGPLQSEVYDALRARYAGMLALPLSDELVLAQKGRAVLTLLAAATNPGLIVQREREEAALNMVWPPEDVHDDARLMDAVYRFARVEVPAKYTATAQLVSALTARGNKVLVWSSFVGNLRGLARVLEPQRPVVIHGGVPTVSRPGVPSRADLLDRFRNDPSCGVLLANPQTLGEGVSLHQVCHHAVYVDRTYDAGQFLQSLDRIHRLGLPPDVETHVYSFVANGTVDERVAVRLAAKVGRLAAALNDPGLVASALPSVDDDGFLDAGADRLDLDDLLSHLV